MHEKLTSSPIYSTLAAEPDLLELVEDYVGMMPERIAALVRALENNDFAQLEVLSHQLKGSLGSYGFDSLTPLAAEFEHKVKTREAEDEILDTMRVLLEQCQRLTADPPPADSL